MAPVDETGAIRLYNGSSGKVHLIVDVAGYLLAPDLTWSAAEEVDRFHSVLAKVSCPTATFCIGGDGFGDASVFNGSSWAAPQNIDARRALQSVSCPTTTFCVAVDQGGRARSRECELAHRRLLHVRVLLCRGRRPGQLGRVRRRLADPRRCAERGRAQRSVLHLADVLRRRRRQRRVPDLRRQHLDQRRYSCTGRAARHGLVHGVGLLPRRR